MRDPLDLFSSGQLRNIKGKNKILDEQLNNPNVIANFVKLEFVLNVGFCHEEIVIPKESTTFGLKW